MGIREFINYWEEKINNMYDGELQELYDTVEFVLKLKDTEVRIPFDAVSYNAFVAALEEIERES